MHFSEYGLCGDWCAEIHNTLQGQTWSLAAEVFTFLTGLRSCRLMRTVNFCMSQLGIWQRFRYISSLEHCWTLLLFTVSSFSLYNEGCLYISFTDGTCSEQRPNKVTTVRSRCSVTANHLLSRDPDVPLIIGMAGREVARLVHPGDAFAVLGDVNVNM